MNRTEHLLSCMAEECTEIGQRVSKALRFGLNDIQPGQSFTNAELIVQEYSDLTAVAYMLVDEGVLKFGDEPTPETIKAKIAKVEKFMLHARKMGALV